MKKIMNSPDLGILLFRLFIGLSIAFAHGLDKVPPSGQFIIWVSSLGFPVPALFAWCAALSEFLGGVLIASGLFIRHAAGFLGFTMTVAVICVHGNDPFDVKERALLYLSACVLLIFHGAGRFSLDHIFRKK